MVKQPGASAALSDCSGKSTYYRYDERHHLAAVTDALNNTTTRCRDMAAAQPERGSLK
nr:RHS repeat protein [Pseudomonas amygdali]